MRPRHSCIDMGQAFRDPHLWSYHPAEEPLADAADDPLEHRVQAGLCRAAPPLLQLEPDLPPYTGSMPCVAWLGSRSQV